MTRPELHLFIIWEKGRSEEKSILKDIEERFSILKIYEIEWSKKRFSQNLTRFYGTNLPPGSGKEEHAGTGPFLLVVVEDTVPRYKMHDTSKGDALVNSNMFLAKTRHREWTGGGHRIHATNSPEETDHDLSLLLGVNTADFRAKFAEPQKSRKPQHIKQDLAGAEGWQSLEQFFYILNAAVPYVVLRNYDPLPDNYYAGAHGDIDLLARDYATICYVTNSTPVFPESFRVHHKVRIGKEDVLFDFRFAGDEYYDVTWQHEILEKRHLHEKGFYVMPGVDQFYTLLYHALIHKPKIADDYITTLTALAAENNIRLHISEDAFPVAKSLDMLARYLARHGYGITRPQDGSVFLNEENLRQLRMAYYKYTDPYLKYFLRAMYDVWRKAREPARRRLDGPGE